MEKYLRWTRCWKPLDEGTLVHSTERQPSMQQQRSVTSPRTTVLETRKHTNELLLVFSICLLSQNDSPLKGSVRQ